MTLDLRALAKSFLDSHPDDAAVVQPSDLFGAL